MNNRNTRNPNTNHNEDNLRVRTLDLPGGMGRIGIKELLVDLPTPEGRSPKTPRLVAIHHHSTHREWAPKDDAGYVLLMIGGNAVVVQVLNRVIREVFVITSAKELVMRPSSAARRLAFRKAAQWLLALPEHGGFDLTIDPNLTAADEAEAEAVARRLAESMGKTIEEQPDTPAPRKEVVEPEDAGQPAHSGKLTGRPGRGRGSEDEDRSRRNRGRGSKVKPVDPRQATVLYAATRTVDAGVSGDTAQRAIQLAEKRAARDVRLAQGG